jgi:hypothetical protein
LFEIYQPVKENSMSAIQVQIQKVYPQRGHVYTLHEVEKVLDLDDSAHLGIVYQGKRTVIQTSHLTADQLLSVPGFKDTFWRYLYTTHEWIPVFEYDVDENRPITDFVDVEQWLEQDGPTEGWWCTPKGFPREQYYAAEWAERQKQDAEEAKAYSLQQAEVDGFEAGYAGKLDNIFEASTEHHAKYAEGVQRGVERRKLEDEDAAADDPALDVYNPNHRATVIRRMRVHHGY